MCGKTQSIGKILSEAALTGFHAAAHKARITPGNGGADALPQTQALASHPSVGAADWVHRRNGHPSAQVGWRIANDAKLPFEYSDFSNEGTDCPVGSKQHPRQLLKESGAFEVPNW